MKILGNRALDLSTKMGFSQEELLAALPREIPYTRSIVPQICVIDGIVYYAKQVDEDELLNELIGSLLARRLNLDTADYQVGVDSFGNLYAMSELFYQFNNSYSHPMAGVAAGLDIFELDMEKCKRFYCKDCIYALNETMADAILKLSALDIKMCQMDRHTHNIMVKTNKTTKEKSLAPAYDYGFAYPSFDMKPEELFYDNPYVLLRKNEPSIEKLIKRYPVFYDYIKSMAGISMDDIISQIEKEHDLLISGNQKRFYIDKDIEYSTPLKKVIGE